MNFETKAELFGEIYFLIRNTYINEKSFLTDLLRSGNLAKKSVNLFEDYLEIEISHPTIHSVFVQIEIINSHYIKYKGYKKSNDKSVITSFENLFQDIISSFKVDISKEEYERLKLSYLVSIKKERAFGVRDQFSVISLEEEIKNIYSKFVSLASQNYHDGNVKGIPNLVIISEKIKNFTKDMTVERLNKIIDGKLFLYLKVNTMFTDPFYLIFETQLNNEDDRKYFYKGYSLDFNKEGKTSLNSLNEDILSIFGGNAQYISKKMKAAQEKKIKKAIKKLEKTEDNSLGINSNIKDKTPKPKKENQAKEAKKSNKIILEFEE